MLNYLKNVSSKVFNKLYFQAHEEVEVPEAETSKSPQAEKVDEASKPSSEKMPESPKVSEKQVSEPLSVEVLNTHSQYHKKHLSLKTF